MAIVAEPPRLILFTGKGGVGKTSSACATAISLADAGKRILLVSTDPASNLDQVFDVVLNDRPSPVTNVPGLWALNIDPVRAAQTYRERIVGPYRGLLPSSAVASIEEQLSGACTVEIAAFEQFSALLADREAMADFDHILFDTAPTGHTLLLLDAAQTYHREVLRRFDASVEDIARLLPRLRDPAFNHVVLVTLAEATPFEEAKALEADLARAGIGVEVWVVNQSLVPLGVTDPVLASRRNNQAALLLEIARRAPRVLALPWRDTAMKTAAAI